MTASFEKVTNRLGWRVDHPHGLARAEAVRRAEVKVDALQPQLLRQLDDLLLELGALLSLRNAPPGEAAEKLYDTSSTLGGIAGNVKLWPLTMIAYGLCDLIDANPDMGAAILFAALVHLKCMHRLREQYGCEFPAVKQSLMSLRDRVGACATEGATTSGLICFVYGSSAISDDVTFDASIESIGRASAVRNAQTNVTGLLVAHTQWYLQYLEGPADPLAVLVSSLLLDRRHLDMEVINTASVCSRRYPGWSMRTSKIAGPNAEIDVPVRSSFKPQNLNEAQALALLDSVSRL